MGTPDGAERIIRCAPAGFAVRERLIDEVIERWEVPQNLRDESCRCPPPKPALLGHSPSQDGLTVQRMPLAPNLALTGRAEICSSSVIKRDVQPRLSGRGQGCGSAYRMKKAGRGRSDSCISRYHHHHDDRHATSESTQ